MVWVFAAIAAAMNLGAYFFSDKMVLALNRARPLEPGEDPALERMVRELAAAASIPVPRTYVIDDPSPNAFATGRNPQNGVVAVTTGIRQLLTERELRGVIAHELAHIANRDILVASIAATVASAVALIASVVRWGALLGGLGGQRDDGEGGGNLLAGLALAIVAPIAATVVQLAISRTREYGADRAGAMLSGDPLALASALAKLERGNRAIPLHTAGDNPATASLFICAPLSAGGMVRWFSTHPPIADRIRHLEELAAAARRGRRVAA